VAKVHLAGIRFSLYIDDGRFLAKTMEESDMFRDQIKEILTRSGW